MAGLKYIGRAGHCDERNSAASRRLREAAGVNISNGATSDAVGIDAARGRSRGVLARRVLVAALAVWVCASGAFGQDAAELNAEGVRAYNERRWDDAITAFAKAYDLAKDNSTVRRNLCNAYQAQANELARANDFTTATELLEIAISVDPENPSPLLQLGSYYLHQDLNAEAVYRLEEAVELDPNNLDAQELLGDAYYKQNDLASALAQWEAVREAEPTRRNLEAKLEKAYREESVEGAFNRNQSAHFQFSSGVTGTDLGKVLRILESAYREIGRKTGKYPPTPIQVTVYNAPQDFERATLLGSHVGAVYDGKIRVPVRDEQGNLLPDDELARRLYHEYTHVVVRFWAGANVPWWLNEGLAETFSHELSASDSEMLREAQQQGLLFPLSMLEDGQLKKLSPEELQLAYRQAHATVNFLWNRTGYKGLESMMNELQAGTGAEEALIVSYRLNYDLLQREVTANFGRTLSQR